MYKVITSSLFYVIGSLTIFLLHFLLMWIWLPTYFTREMVALISKVFRDMGRPLSWTDTLLLEDFNGRHRVSEVLMCTFEGVISAETLCRLFTKNVLELKQSNSAQPKFSELTQYQTSLLGFRFWRKDPNFRIENHVKEVCCYDGNIPNYFKTYEGILREFTGRPYPPKRSPWELWVVRNFEDGETPRTVLIWRVHHSFMDGWSVMNVIIHALGEKAIPIPHMSGGNVKKSRQPLKRKRRDIFSSLKKIIDGFFLLVVATIQNIRAKELLHLERQRRGVVMKGKIHFKFSEKLPLHLVKEVAAKFGIRVSSLLYALIAHNFAKIWMLEIDPISVPYVLPLPNHPETLVNHMAMGQILLPINKGYSIQTRMKLINKCILEIEINPVIRVFRYVEYLVGNCVPALALFLRDSLAYTPITLTNFSAGSEGFQIGGMECQDLRPGMGPYKDTTDSIIGILGYKNEIRISFAVDDVLLCESDVERISSGIEEDFCELLLQNHF